MKKLAIYFMKDILWIGIKFKMKCNTCGNKWEIYQFSNNFSIDANPKCTKCKRKNTTLEIW